MKKTLSPFEKRVRNIERFIFFAVLFGITSYSLLQPTKIVEKYGELVFISYFILFSMFYFLTFYYLTSIIIVISEDASNRFKEVLLKYKRWIPIPFIIIGILVLISILTFLGYQWNEIVGNSIFIIIGIIIVNVKKIYNMIQSRFSGKQMELKKWDYDIEIKLEKLYYPLNDLLQNSTFFQGNEGIDLHGKNPAIESKYTIEDILPYQNLASERLKDHLKEFIQVLREHKLPLNMEFEEFKNSIEVIKEIIIQDIERFEKN